ncbi:MAG: YbjQ family protein [Candidatus Bathyarchaeota archaeon]|nr:YbjQ family protein [Candidatus Termiticorpusculum sp.]
MILSTTEYISGKELEILGLVQGNVVQTKSIKKDLKAVRKNFVGGEIEDYTDLLKESYGIATERMIQAAKDMGADAIIAVRYSTSSIVESASEVMAYGTAVKFI